ncbi:MAG: carboxypeptidase regulatory-like domain-containing protein [Thermoplasmata archaeon]|nr:carboxypeptidase regulatory-like domain-containing protein [Thermoplasmata archaeon]
MKTKALVALIAIMMVVTSVPTILCSFDSDAGSFDINTKIDTNSEIEFKGKVRYNTPLGSDSPPNVVVLIVENIEGVSGLPANHYITEPYSAKIDKNTDTFSIKVPRITATGVSYYFLIESGYEIDIITEWFHPVPETILRYEEGDIDHSKYPTQYKEAYRLVDAPKKTPPYQTLETFAVSGMEDNERNVIGAVRIAGNLQVTVHHQDYNLSNVSVSLLRDGETKTSSDLTELTNNQGICTISDIPTGWYNVVTTLQDYEQKGESRVYIDKNVTTNITIEMDPTTNDKDFWGYDLPHFLMICGGAIGAIIIVISIVMQRRTIKGNKEDWIFNDIEDEEEED